MRTRRTAPSCNHPNGRTRREGIAQAKQRGVYQGRKKSLTEDQALALVERATSGEAKAVLAKQFGVSRETVYTYLRTTDPAK